MIDEGVNALGEDILVFPFHEIANGSKKKKGERMHEGQDDESG